MLGKPIVRTTKLKLDDGTKIIDYKYKFDAPINKRKVDKMVKDKLKEILKENGSFRGGVSYMVDTSYSTDFQQYNINDDIDDQFMPNEFRDSSGVGDLDGESKVKFVNLYIADANVKVGASEHNDCFYNHFSKAFDPFHMPEDLKSPEIFKKAWGLDRDDKVSLRLIGEMEDKYEICIDTYGQYDHTSKKNFPRRIKLKIYENHVREARKINMYTRLMSGYTNSKTTRYPIFFKYEGAKVKFARFVDGNSGEIITWREPKCTMNDLESHPLRFKFFFVQAKKKTEPEDNLRSHIDTMEIFKKIADQELGDRAKDSLNGFHSKFRWRPMASQYFYKIAPLSISFCDDYMDQEDVVLRKALMGGIIYGKKGFVQNATDADVNSMFADLMLKVDFITRQGVFSMVDEIPKLTMQDEYKIFKCKISGSDKRIFRQNKEEWYPALDVLVAQKEGYKIELCKNDINCLTYDENTRIRGSEVFRTFVHDLYKLKKMGLEGAKDVLNVLWGFFASRSTYTKYTNKEVCAPDASFIKSMRPMIGSKTEKVKIYKQKKDKSQEIFAVPYARFTPFLTARARYVMYCTLGPVKEHIQRIHTDGAILDIPIQLDTGDELGQWKCYQGSCTVVNSCKVKWHFINKPEKKYLKV